MDSEMQDLELEKEFEVEEDHGLLQNNPVVVEVVDVDNQVEVAEGDGGNNGRKRKLPPRPRLKPKDKQPSTRTPAKCWQHFEKIYEGGILKWGECKYCKKRYAAETQKHGTSNLRGHIPDGCKEYPYNDQKKGQQNLSFKQTDEGVEDGEEDEVEEWLNEALAEVEVREVGQGESKGRAAGEAMEKRVIEIMKRLYDVYANAGEVRVEAPRAMPSATMNDDCNDPRLSLASRFKTFLEEECASECESEVEKYLIHPCEPRKVEEKDKEEEFDILVCKELGHWCSDEMMP
ncbi:hypothetical protein Vadar_030638 [Vaccinium darrowii]|uniref:Uncharacterized protein n=1 Tax=Vaccinium darrowii TaxID=229202 RepID=A0ACB7XW36_9ERIC|nr:hypothetical protein Vadar_030638 [Vaccinium darrowii]